MAGQARVDCTKLKLIMPTATETRTVIVLSFSKQLGTIIDNESRYSGLPVATLIRHIVKWHAGKGAPRHEGAPEPKFPKKISKERKNKTVLIDDKDAVYLDKLGKRAGFTRVATLMFVIYQYFGIDPLPQSLISH